MIEHQLPIKQGNKTLEGSVQANQITAKVKEERDWACERIAVKKD